MGHRGPPPKPTALKLVQGNPGRRAIKSNEPKPQIVAPECPTHLTADARQEWDRVIPILLGLRIVSELDMAALSLYCQSYGRWKEAEKRIAEMREKGGDGLLIKAPSGYPIVNPYLAIANRAMEDCHKYLQQFGMSPAARTRVEVHPQGDLFENDKAAKYF